MPALAHSLKPLLPWSVALLSLGAVAQTTPPAAVQAAAILPTTLNHQSALEGYQPYAEQEVRSWREANDLVGRIGGWRAYARETGTTESALPAAENRAKADTHHEAGKR